MLIIINFYHQEGKVLPRDNKTLVDNDADHFTDTPSSPVFCIFFFVFFYFSFLVFGMIV